MAKKKTEANFGNVCGNVPKICKRFKSVFGEGESKRYNYLQ